MAQQQSDMRGSDTPTSAPTTEIDVLMTREQYLRYWQGHRDLTRKTIEAFPDDQLFTFSIGGMRTFGELANEMLRMAGPTAEGAATGEWKDFPGERPTNKRELLDVWDQETKRIDELWLQIPPGRFQQEEMAFGQWPGTIIWLLNYIVDNEVHHRAQGYVYLRALGIEPPSFWDRQE